jgi:hypothetical protein
MFLACSVNQTVKRFKELCCCSSYSYLLHMSASGNLSTPDLNLTTSCAVWQDSASRISSSVCLHHKEDAVKPSNIAYFWARDRNATHVLYISTLPMVIIRRELYQLTRCTMWNAYGKTANIRSQWPGGLKASVSGRSLLGLRVRIPLGAWMFVCCECCVFSGRGLCDGPIPRPEESYRLWRVIVCWFINLKNEAALARVELLRQRKKK